MVRLSDWVERAGRLALKFAAMPLLLRVTSFMRIFYCNWHKNWTVLSNSWVQESVKNLGFGRSIQNGKWRREEPNQDMVGRLTWFRSRAHYFSEVVQRNLVCLEANNQGIVDFNMEQAFFYWYTIWPSGCPVSERNLISSDQGVACILGLPLEAMATTLNARNRYKHHTWVQTQTRRFN